MGNKGGWPGAVVNKGRGLMQWVTRVGAWCSG